MNLIFINESKKVWPKKFVSELLLKVIKELKKRKVRNYKRLSPHAELTLVFLPKTKAKRVNREYRGRDYATDVLSFLTEGDCLGDLVICPEVIEKQAKEHDLKFNQELAYMIIHGLLHLLGYDHEESKKEERLMFALQDEIFELIVI